MPDSPTPKRAHILTSSVDVFSRYGYRRTSMELIAEAADVSRPALYQHFRNKKDVFQGVAALIGEQMADAARTAATSHTTPPDQLYAVLSIKLEAAIGVADAGYRQELIAEAGDLGLSPLSPLEEALIDLLQAHLATNAPETAALLLDSTTGIGQSDAPPDILRSRLRHLVTLVAHAPEVSAPDASISDAPAPDAPAPNAAAPRSALR